MIYDVHLRPDIVIFIVRLSDEGLLLFDMQGYPLEYTPVPLAWELVIYWTQSILQLLDILIKEWAPWSGLYID